MPRKHYPFRLSLRCEIWQNPEQPSGAGDYDRAGRCQRSARYWLEDLRDLPGLLFACCEQCYEYSYGDASPAVPKNGARIIAILADEPGYLLVRELGLAAIGS